MRDLSYDNHTFRLDEETVKELKKLKRRLGLSYNLLFLEIMKEYEPNKPERVTK
jgi:hypothetical protein